MSIEKKEVIILNNKKDRIKASLNIYEEVPDKIDMVSIELNFCDCRYIEEADNLFSALINLRKKLEKDDYQIVCNGSAINVYPSPMQLGMGTGRKAYVLHQGKKATMQDVVDIFEYDNRFEIVKIDVQHDYYEQWINSIRN